MNENTFNSRLQLLRFVQDKLSSLEFDINQNKPFRRFRLYSNSGSDGEWIPLSRSDVELLRQTLIDAAQQFGIDPLPIEWDEPSDTHSSNLPNDAETLQALLKMDVKTQQALLNDAEKLQNSAIVGDSLSKTEQALLNDAETLQALLKMDAETMQALLTEWRTRIRSAVFASGELPKGWVISDSNLPPNPIQSCGALAEWLNGCLSWIHETNTADRSWAKAEKNLGDFQRELQNARRAIHALRIPLSFAFDKAPENVNDAEDKLRRLIDELNIVDGNGGRQQAPQVEASEQGRDAAVQADMTEPAAPNGNSVNSWNVPKWLPPQSVTRLIKETGCSRTTINDELRSGSIPGGSERESNKPRGDVIITAIGLQYLKRKGGKSEQDQR